MHPNSGNPNHAIGAAVAIIISIFSINTHGRTPRPIIVDGTVKAANGDLLRGTTLHVSKTYSARARDYGLSYSNMRILRDQCHMNLIRLGLNDPFEVFDGDTAAAFDSIEQTYYWADSIIKVCDSLGMYVQLNFHSPGYNWTPSKPWGEWDVRNFWAHYAPRYKDKPFVMYQLFNEGIDPRQAVSPILTNRWKQVYDIVRAAAPDNIVYHVDVVALSMNWGPYLKNTYAPALGFSWDSGKDLFSFHSYTYEYAQTMVEDIQLARKWGIPLAPPEFTASELWPCCPPPFLEKCHYPSEWYERNGISWTLWYNWNDPDQAKGLLTLICPDAMKKGYAWWNPIKPPSTPTNFSARSLDSYNVALTWGKPADTGNGILGYRVYRDGIDVSYPCWPTGTTYTDTGLHASTTYTYQIAARTFGGVVSLKSLAIQVTMPVDNTSPIPTLVCGAGDGTKVRVFFAEPINKAIAETIANYAITPAGGGNITIKTAALAPDMTTLTLTTSNMTKGTSYALTMNNIADIAAAPNTIPPNTALSFKCIDGITAIRFFPRAGFAALMGYGIFEGTNGSPVNGPYTRLYRLPGYAPVEHFWTPTSETQWMGLPESPWNAPPNYRNFDIGYRYIRYRTGEEYVEGRQSPCTVAEIEFYSGSVKVSGTPFGAAGSSAGNDYAKALDGDTTTYFEHTGKDGYVGFDFGERGLGMEPAHPSPGHAPDLRIAAGNGRICVRVAGMGTRCPILVLLYDLRGALVRAQAGRTDEQGRAAMVIGNDDAANPSLTNGNYALLIKSGGFKEKRIISLIR